MLFSDRQPIYTSCMTISGARTEQYVIIAGFLPRHSLALRVIFIRQKRLLIYESCMTIWAKKQTTGYNRFWRAGCSRLEYVDIRSLY